MENKLKNKKLRVSFSLIPRYIYNKLEELNIPYVLETEEIDYDLLQN